MADGSAMPTALPHTFERAWHVVGTEKNVNAVSEQMKCLSWVHLIMKQNPFVV